MILHLCIPTRRRYVPFKFLNIWAARDDFMDVVGSSWQIPVSGNPMYRLTTKLCRLKSVLRTLHHHHTSDITGRVASAREDWFAAQHFLDEHPASVEAQQSERSLASRYMQLCKDEEAYFKQRSRIQWLQLGDKNTAFFHKSLLHRQTRNRIHMLQDESVLLRNRSFWHINTSNPSWSWRKILQSRDWCRGWFTTRIGNGSLTSLWYDYWLPHGKRLIDDFSLRNLTATGLPWTTKVSDIITNGQWQFPPSSSELQAIWDSIRFLPCSSSPDICTWKGHPSGEFSIASAWELIRDIRPVTSIHHLLWFRGHIPRHSFILWLACRGRLRTMDRLHSVGIITNNTCILCGNYAESHEHLFFECTFSGTVWRAINTKAKLQWPCIPWQQLL
ncbi:hypothetical protein NC652_026984 [Populus alba x Populus x berolinensis]|nr:hypothetical protein NC652_026984 [Populus alba x Populus x berolinensis]